MNLEVELKKNLSQLTFNNDLQKVLEYSIFPTGKLFRPKVVEAVALDMGPSMNHDQLLWALSLEIHHAYTLIHDDLPCMDNDDYRRGKLSTHKAFGEWQAVLSGDVLLLASIEILTHLNHPSHKQLLRLYTKFTGAKGLVLGQWMDLSLWAEKDFNKIIRMHELKTGKLFQLAILGSAVLSNQKLTLSELKKFFRLGREMGIYFQLIDDLGDVNSRDNNSHENDINPFVHFHVECMAKIEDCTKKISYILNDLKLLHLKNILVNYQENQLMKKEMNSIKLPLIF